MILDLNLRTLSYKVNGSDYGVAHRNIEATSYRACVSTNYNGNSIEIVKYSTDQYVVKDKQNDDHKCNNCETLTTKNKILTEQNDELRAETAIKTATINRLRTGSEIGKTDIRINE